MKINFFPVILLGLILSLPACEGDKIETSIEFYTAGEFKILSENLNLPSVPYSYSHSKPGQPGPRPSGGFEPTIFNDHVATLGRVLFYDKQLSSDNSVSCASCHKQQLAFADDVAFSTGIMGRSTTRNSIALGVFTSFGDYSSSPQTTLFWDGRAENLHDQMIQTIGNPNEMGMSMTEVEEKVRDLEYYKVLSRKAFGTETLVKTSILIALESFINSITSNASKLDKTFHSLSVSGDLAGFTVEQNEGKRLFQENCLNCHSQGLEILGSFPEIFEANNGLDLEYSDKGKGEINSSLQAIGIFKVPSLRNIQLTAPYMHDGRFSYLEQVIDFYSTGIQDHQNLHEQLKDNGQAKKFNFTTVQKNALVAFLHTLTDLNMTHEVKWSDPFL